MYISSSAGGNLAVLNRRPETSPSALARFLPTSTTLSPTRRPSSAHPRRFPGHCVLRWHPKQTQAMVTQYTAGAFWPMRLEHARGGTASMRSAGDSRRFFSFGVSRVHLDVDVDVDVDVDGQQRVKDGFVHSWTCLGIHLTRLRGREAPPWPWPPAPRFGVRRSALAKPRPIAGEAAGEPASHPFDGGAKACCHPLQEHSQAWASLLPQGDDLPLPA